MISNTQGWGPESTMVSPPSATGAADLTAVVVSHNSAPWLSACLDYLRASAGVRLAVYVVDNASTDESAELVESRYPDVTVVRARANLGFAGGANLGIRKADSELVVVLNPDVTVRPDTLAALAGALWADPRVGLVGAKLLYPDGKTIQHAGGVLAYPLALADHAGYREEDRGQWDEPREVDFATGALLAMRKSAVLALGGFDEGFYPGYFEDTDLCFRARRAGYRVLYEPGAVAVHHESATTGRNTFRYYRYYHRNRIRFVLKHYTDDQLGRDFRPAELAQLRRLGSAVELLALREAYHDGLAVFTDQADSFAALAATLPASEARVRALAELAAAVEELVGPARTGHPALPEDLAPLALIGQLTEPRFVAVTPVVGPLIVRLRRLWNWMSTRWYVGPVLEQQSEFNRMTVEALRQLDAAVRTPRPRRPAGAQPDELAALQKRLRCVEERLDKLERTLANRSD